MRIIDLIFGRKLANREHEERKIGWVTGVPAMGLDGLGSSSYGPEAALTILIPLGAASLHYIGWVIAPIIGLLVILYFSYRQTLLAYPSNGGAYTVAKENLGRGGALLAASALMIDYVLNVAVGISAGVGALTSAVPELHAYTLWLCLGILAVVAIANLRGTREAGWLFSVPTYVFLISFFGIMALGIARLSLGGGPPEPVVAPPPLSRETEALSVWLLMRAFAAGCTAMTGVEAVSNGVDAFKEPVVREARATLTVICLALGALLVGIAIIAQGYQIGAMDQTQPGYQSVMSQLLGAIVGRGPLYYIAIASLLAILCLSANTSFVAFPRICRLVALDDYLPRSFAVSDRRLVFSAGVLFLTLTGGALLILFEGITDRLIPLFAIGAFMTFTLSQIGMVVHWRRVGGEGRRLLINALGAVVTGVALIVIAVAKFAEGAWIVAITVPAAIGLLLVVKNYYRRQERTLSVRGEFKIEQTQPPTVLVAYEERNRMTDRALQFALSLSPDVVAVHLLRLRDPEMEEDLAEAREAFEKDIAEPVAAAGLTPPRLMFLRTAYREMSGPLLELIEKIDAAAPERTVAILVPERVHRHWWQWLLHGRRARQLRAALMEHAGPRLMIVSAPWQEPAGVRS